MVIVRFEPNYNYLKIFLNFPDVFVAMVKTKMSSDFIVVKFPNTPIFKHNVLFKAMKKRPSDFVVMGY